MTARMLYYDIWVLQEKIRKRWFNIMVDKDKTDKMVPISSLPISTRLRNGLRRNGIDYLQQLEKCTEENILRIRNIGVYSLQELKNICEQYGVQIGSCVDMKD